MSGTYNVIQLVESKITKDRDQKTMGKKMYLKPDGNGGVNISKGMMALITLTLIMVTVVASVVAYGSNIKADVEHNTETLQTCMGNTADIVRIETKIENIESDVSEMRQDIKTLLQRSEK